MNGRPRGGFYDGKGKIPRVPPCFGEALMRVSIAENIDFHDLGTNPLFMQVSPEPVFLLFTYSIQGLIFYHSLKKYRPDLPLKKYTREFLHELWFF